MYFLLFSSLFSVPLAKYYGRYGIGAVLSTDACAASCVIGCCSVLFSSFNVFRLYSGVINNDDKTHWT